MCTAFEVGESTVHAKARVMEEMLGTRPFDPQWTLPSLVERNPLVRMAEVNGLLVDLRDMPRDGQEIAFAKGLIPYISPAVVMYGENDLSPRKLTLPRA